MRIEKQETGENKLPAIYDKSIKGLTEGGVSPEEAYEMIRQAHIKFHERIAAPMIVRMIADIIANMEKDSKTPSLADIQKMSDKLSFELQKQLASSADTKLKTIYEGPGGVKLRENSNN